MYRRVTVRVCRVVIGCNVTVHGCQVVIGCNVSTHVTQASSCERI